MQCIFAAQAWGGYSPAMHIYSTVLHSCSPFCEMLQLRPGVVGPPPCTFTAPLSCTCAARLWDAVHVFSSLWGDWSSAMHIDSTSAARICSACVDATNSWAQCTCSASLGGLQCRFAFWGLQCACATSLASAVWGPYHGAVKGRGRRGRWAWGLNPV